MSSRNVILNDVGAKKQNDVSNEKDTNITTSPTKKSVTKLSSRNVILNDVGAKKQNDVSNKKDINMTTSKTKKSVTKLLSRNFILNDDGAKKQNNISNDVDVEKDCDVTSSKMNDNNIDVEKDTNITAPKANNNNISNKLVSGMDIVIDNISMISQITRDCSLCKMKFETSFAVNKDSSNPLKAFCSPCYYTTIQNQSS